MPDPHPGELPEFIGRQLHTWCEITTVHGHLPNYLNQNPHHGGTHKPHSSSGSDISNWADCPKAGVTTEMNKSLQIRIVGWVKPDTWQSSDNPWNHCPQPNHLLLSLMTGSPQQLLSFREKILPHHSESQRSISLQHFKNEVSVPAEINTVIEILSTGFLLLHLSLFQ